MIDLFTTVLPYKVLASHFLLVVLLLSLIMRGGWGRPVASFLGKHAEMLSLLVALAAVIGSLFYSNVIGFEPCVLCWWQRIFLYPLVVVFGAALWRKDKSAFLYAVPLTLLAAIVSLYQAYSNASGASLLPCTAAEGACSRIYVEAFGYITIPVMSLTIVAYLLLLAWAHRLYTRDEDSHA